MELNADGVSVTGSPRGVLFTFVVFGGENVNISLGRDFLPELAEMIAAVMATSDAPKD